MDKDHSWLIAECAKGNRNAQKQLYEMFSEAMYVVSMRYSKSDLEAEDILQEAFIKVFRNIKNFRGESRLGYWIKRIVINTALNSQRNKLYMFPMVDVENVQHHFDYEQILSGFQMEDLLEMIQELPVGCQTVFNLFAIEGYSHKEIGDLLEISEGTSKSQYARARKLLQEKLIREQKKSYENVGK